MKKTLLFCFTAMSVLSIAQNVTENKVNFGYIQLPENPIDDSYTTFEVIVDRTYEKANEDSLMAYQTRLEIASANYEAELNAWREQEKIIQRDYLKQMKKKKKLVDAGQASQQPIRPVASQQPSMVEVKDPMLHSDITDEAVTSKITLEGYSKAPGGASITLGVLPISDFSIVNKKTGSGTSTKYVYSANYKLPMTIKVETPSQGVILNTIIRNTIQVYNLETYVTPYDFQLWWLDNEASFWIDFEQKVRNVVFAETKETINNKCGYPIKTRACEVYTVKKFKDHSYNDLTNAYSAAQQGYMGISGSRDYTGGHSKLQEANNIWEQMLKESNLSDNKSRVNDKVTALLYCNLAESYCWLNDFNNSMRYINLAKGAGVNKFKRIAERIEKVVNNNKNRFNANN